MSAAAAVGELFAGWVRYREGQVAALVAAGVRGPGEIAARLGMTAEAAGEYLARVMDVHTVGAGAHESRGGEEVVVPRVAAASSPPRGV